MLRCSVCDEPIEEERIKTFLSATGKLPDTCVKHASKPKRVGITVYSHKTAGECIVLSNPTGEQLRQARRAYERRR